jgi:hypothetical protein
MTLGDGDNKFLVKIRNGDTDVRVAVGSLSHAQAQENSAEAEVVMHWIIRERARGVAPK